MSQDLITRGEAVLTEMDTLRRQLSETTDEATRTCLDGSLKAKSMEFDRIRASLEAEQRSAEGRAMIREAKRMSDVSAEGKTLIPAEPRDHRSEERAKVEGFFAYMGSKAISPRQLDLLKPRSARFQSAADGVVVPDSVAIGILGKAYAGAFGKSLPMASSDETRAALVAEDYRRRLLELPPEAPHILNRATVVPAPTGAVVWPRLVQADADELGGVTGNWISEGTEKPAAEAEFDQVTIPCHEYAAYTEVSNRLLSRSAIQMEQLITRLFRSAVLNALDAAFLAGTGEGQPLGIVATPTVREVNRAAAGAVGYADLVNLEHAVRAYHRSGATFLMSDGAVRQLKLALDTADRPIFVPSVAGGVPDTLLGYPYVATHRLTLGVEGDVLFGNLAEYIVAMEEEVVVKRSEHYKFRDNVTAFTVSVSVGGRLIQPRAMAMLTDALPG